MRCPNCGSLETRVLDSRPTEDGYAIRRRRECMNCGFRFTTYERFEIGPVLVVKKDGRREKFDREKIKRGVMKACEKRQVSMEEVEKLISNVELKLQKEGKLEVESKRIGELVMEELRKLDKVAYVRFASVYKDFRDIDEFLEIVKGLKKEGRE
ncbi:MAG: transcriptional regulator NrdR [Thermotoga sp.]|nr:MAG: transcriptional regulator NrdR [Thermotoga sp.]